MAHTAVVVAIDFGTATTGYAFAYTTFPDEIFINKTWPNGPVEAKTLTEILLNHQHAVIAFGHQARDKFASMNYMERLNYLYFSKFKMTLHNQAGVNRRTVKASNCNSEICVNKLIGLCLGEIKKQALSELRETILNASNILWVITVPAIWDISAREAMKEAAVQAGIPRDNVVIALEPEVATINCMRNQNKVNVKTFMANPFMVVDAGGGTVDITVHSLNANGTLSEVHIPSGGGWGSTYINQEFVSLLEELFGATHLDTIMKKECWFEVMDSFENQKLKFQDSSNEPPKKNFSISSLGGKPNLANLVKYAGLGIKLSNGILRIPTTAFRKFYAPVVQKISMHIQYLLDTPDCKQVKYLFLVGGFAESPLLQKAIQDTVGSKVQILIPPRPGMSVLTGAVQYGFTPEVVSTRIALRTLGVSGCVIWNAALHKGRQSVIDHEGVKKCSDVLDTLVRAQDRINIDDVIRRERIPMQYGQSTATLSVYSSLNRHVPFVTDAGVTKIGELTMEIPEPLLDPKLRKVDVMMKFGGTVFSVTATYTRTGKSVKADFIIPL